MSWARIGAILWKELRDYRRNRFIVSTMAVMPLLFIALPTVEIFTLPSTLSASMLDKRIGLALLYMLLIPTVLPAALSAYSVVGEREQGTLEPILTTPIRREEFLLGKGLANLIPTLLVAYAAFGVFLACVELFAHHNVAAAVFRGSELLAQVLFTPLLAGWAIWAGIAMSTRSSDVRVAQQLSMLVSLPPLAIAAMFSFSIIKPTFGLAVAFALPLLAFDIVGWRIVSVLFDRERLVAGWKG